MVTRSSLLLKHGMPRAFKRGQKPEPSIPAESSANGQRPTGPRPGEKSGVAFALHLTRMVHVPITHASSGICVQGVLAATRPPMGAVQEKWKRL